jgi:hypothetical protein
MKRVGSVVPQILLAFVLTVPMLLLWGLGSAWARQVIDSFARQPINYERLLIRRDGTPLVERSMIEPNGQHRATSYKTLDGEAIGDFAGSDNASLTQLIAPPRPRKSPLRLPWSRRIDSYGIGFKTTGATPELWYFVHDGRLDGRGYAVGYDGNSRRLIGYIGVNGISPTVPPFEDQIDVSEAYLRYREISYSQSDGTEAWYESTAAMYLCPDRIIGFDFRGRKIDTLWKGQGAVCMGGLERLAPSMKIPIFQENRRIIRTPNRLYLLDKDQKEDYSIEIPESLQTFVLEVAELPEGGILAIAYKDLYRHGQERKVAWLTRDGKAKIVDVTLEVSNTARESWPANAASIPSPVVFTLFWIASGYGQSFDEESDSWGDWLRVHWPEFWPALLGIFIVSGIFAAWTYRRQRRFGLGHEIAWAAFVLALGPLAAFAYLVHRAWPVREACPKCNAAAPRDREACFACGSEFPSPARLSTEIRV